MYTFDRYADLFGAEAWFADDPLMLHWQTDYLAAGTVYEEAGVSYTIPADMLRVLLEFSAEEGSFQRAEYFLPRAWEGRFIGYGNGGLAGGLPIAQPIEAAGRGFLTATCDLGTSEGQDAGIRNPAMAADFGHRATHLMTVYAKLLAEKLYHAAPEFSYFFGGSTGGEQALSEAQRYPGDYDGIIAGAPANNRIALHTYFIWNFVHTRDTSGHPLFDEALTQKIHQAVIAYAQSHGDGLPGDRFVTLPPLQREEIIKLVDHLRKELALSDEVADALRALYEGPYRKNGEPIYCGIPAGSELASFGISDIASRTACPYPYPSIWAMGDSFDPMTFDFDADHDLVLHTLSRHMDANDPDLTPFFSRGGRLLIVSGTADPCVPFQDAYAYSEKVALSSENAKGSFRFFLIPSFDHSRAASLDHGRLTDQSGLSLYDAMIAWREKGIPINAVRAELQGVNDPAPHPREIQPLVPILNQ